MSKASNDNSEPEKADLDPLSGIISNFSWVSEYRDTILRPIESKIIVIEALCRAS